MFVNKFINYFRVYISSFNKWRFDRKEYNHLKRLLKEVKRQSLLNKTIVFNTVGMQRMYIDQEFFLGKILAFNGAKVIMLLDDGVLINRDLAPHVNYRYYKNPLNFFFYKNILKKALSTYKDINLKIIYYSHILSKVNQKNWKELKKFALASTIRYFQTSELDFTDKKVKNIYYSKLKNSVLSRGIGEYIFNKIKPDFYITSHAIYSTWGPAYEYLNKKGIKTLVLARYHVHTKDLQDIYITDAITETLSRSKYWQEYKHTPITKEMEIKVKELIDLRMNHKTIDTRLYFNGNENIFKVDKNDGYKYHFAIFPNLIWDGNIVDRHIAFKGILDWLISTIDYLKIRNDIKIFLKFHPAEVTSFKTSVKIQDLIKNYMNNNQIKNIVLIPTELNIEPYEFLKSGIDLAICYDGFLALEIPLLKIPVLLGAVRGKFNVEGGNFSINNRNEYFNFLKDFEKNIEDFHINYDKYYKNIIRYAYWYLFDIIIKCPINSKKNRFTFEILQLKKENLKIDKKLLNIFKES